MEYRKLLFILGLATAGGAMASEGGSAPLDPAHHHEAGMQGMQAMHGMEGMQGMQGMHQDAHHHHAMAGTGYTLAAASYQTPDVKLVDMQGREVSLHDSLDGPGPVMLNFIFTTCSTVCPVMSETFSQAQAKLDGVRMVSVSIDPEQDTPSKLKAYAQRFEAGPQWSMLSGSLANSIAVQRAFEIYRGDKMNHEPVIFMRKGPNQPWTRINGFISADNLVREFGKLASN